MFQLNDKDTDLKEPLLHDRSSQSHSEKQRGKRSREPSAKSDADEQEKCVWWKVVLSLLIFLSFLYWLGLLTKDALDHNQDS